MSQWTHVNGIIRFDGIFAEELPTKKDLGEICRWEDEDISHWNTTIIPCGSEGSIVYHIIETGDENSLAKMAVAFIGDLRDYDNADEIVSYFNKIVEGRWIRSGVVEINVWGRELVVFRYDHEKLVFVEVYRE